MPGRRRRALYRAVVDAGLEGIVAKRLADGYHPKLRGGTRFSIAQTREAIDAVKRPVLVIASFATEAVVPHAALSALESNYRVSYPEILGARVLRLRGLIYGVMKIRFRG